MHSLRQTIILLLLSIPLNGIAQLQGLFEYENLGISFTIPENWAGQEVENGILLGSKTIPGIVLITTNDVKNMDVMESEAKQGVHEGNGTNLMLVGALNKLDENTIGGEYQGTLEGEIAKAYIIGIINPSGYGITIIAATTSEAYSSIHEKVCLDISKSVKFYESVIPDASANWQDRFENARLTYMESYSSFDYSSDYTTGGGYNSKEVIDLCSEGYFNYSSSSFVSVDEGGAYGSANSRGNGAGTWKVVGNARGESVLQLNFYSGNKSEYVITESDDKTFLNGYRYYRTYGTITDDGPRCN